MSQQVHNLNLIEWISAANLLTVTLGPPAYHQFFILYFVVV